MLPAQARQNSALSGLLASAPKALNHKIRNPLPYRRLRDQEALCIAKEGETAHRSAVAISS
ncbi:hypothetical protein [Sodalis sp.]|uniref:hypothetical protein n=1 Tax=Sodalis sp. (in: enterobacteria) TaxID=1898979 RepID=UPI003872B1D5